jgi:phosphatidylinositol alpha-mannosyltransferase
VKSHIRHLAEHFREWGHDVTIFAPASDPAGVMGECVVMGKPRKLRVSGSVARISFNWSSPAVKDALAAGKFDILHLHEPLMPLLPYHFLRYSSSANVGTFHAAKDGGNRFYSYTTLTRRWFRKLDGKIAVSPAAARLVSRYFAGYYNIIPNGIDYEHFSAPREPLEEFMDGRRNILFVGRPEKRKGLKYLLRAYLRIREQEANTRLIVVGAGSSPLREPDAAVPGCRLPVLRAVRGTPPVPPERHRLRGPKHRQREPGILAPRGARGGASGGGQQHRGLRRSRNQ